MTSHLDRAALAAYCQAYGRWVEAERKLAETPTLIKLPSGYIQPLPWLGIANKQLELMQRPAFSQATLSRMEQGTHLCLVDSLFDVAAALEISAGLLARDLVTWRTATRRRKGAAATPAPRRMSQTQQLAERVRPDFERALAEKPQTYRELVWLLKRDEVPSRWNGEWTPPRARTIVKRLGLQSPGA